jgi:hypothetical protein
MDGPPSFISVHQFYPMGIKWLTPLIRAIMPEKPCPALVESAAGAPDRAAFFSEFPG